MKRNHCPFCGAPSNWREQLKSKKDDGPLWGPWKKRDVSFFGLGNVDEIPAWSEYERRRPIRDPHIESDVVTPGLQALISGVVSGVLAGATAVVMEWGRPWAVGLASGAGVLGILWFALLKENRDLLWEVERVIGADIDGDGITGKPVRQVETIPLKPREVRVEITERHDNGHKRMRFVDVPLDDQELESVAQTVLTHHKSFSRRGLSDVLSQSQYAAVYEAMLDGGLLRKDGRGVELSPSGRAFLSQYLE